MPQTTPTSYLSLKKQLQICWSQSLARIWVPPLGTFDIAEPPCRRNHQGIKDLGRVAEYLQQHAVHLEPRMLQPAQVAKLAPKQLPENGAVTSTASHWIQFY